MNKLFAVTAGATASLALATPAAASPPAWCKGVTAGPADVSRLSSTDVKEVLQTFVSAACVFSPEVDAHRGEIEAARQAWTKRLGMVEADWADVVAYSVTRDDSTIRVAPSSDVLAAAAPIDQYAIITKISEGDSNNARPDTMYAADMFESNLSQLGRFAFLTTTCFDQGRSPAVDSDGMLGTEVSWAICQADFERFDLAKFLDEVRSASTDGAVKMKLRVAAFDLPKRMRDHAADVQQMLKRDDGNRKAFDVAAKARAEWSAGIGRNAKLLELVLAMDSAQLARSRKQLDGCEGKTAAALADAVATLPAKAFAGMHDERNDPFAGFASSAWPVLMQSPAVNLAVIAFVECAPDSAIIRFLDDSLANGPGFRGPRSAALSGIKAANIVYDKMNAKLRFPSSRYGGAYPDGRVTVMSKGGVITSVKRKGEMLAIELEKMLEKQEECLKSHRTTRVQQIRSDGTFIYESVCDKSGIV